MPYLRLNLWILGLMLSLCSCSSDHKELHASSSLSDNCMPYLSKSYAKKLKIGAWNPAGFQLAHQLETRIIERIRNESNFPLLTRMEMICMTESSENILPKKKDVDKVIQILREFEAEENRQLIHIMSTGKIESQEFFPNGKPSAQKKTAQDDYGLTHTQALKFSSTGDTTYYTIMREDFFIEKKMVFDPNKIRIAAIILDFHLSPGIYFSFGAKTIYAKDSDGNVELNTVPELKYNSNLPIHSVSDDKLYKTHNGKWTVEELHDNFKKVGTMDFKNKTWTQEFVNSDTTLTEMLFELDLEKESESRYIWMIESKELVRGFHSNGALSFEYNWNSMEHKTYDENGSMLSKTNELGHTGKWFNELWSVPDIKDY